MKTQFGQTANYAYDYQAQDSEVFNRQSMLRSALGGLAPTKAWINYNMKELPDNLYRFYIEASIAKHDKLIACGFRLSERFK
jgi:hypothetical protein